MYWPLCWGLASAWTKSQSDFFFFLKNFRRSYWLLSKSHYSDSPILHRTDFLFTGIRRNNHQTASCIPSGNRHCSDWTFYLDSSSIYTCRNLFQRKSSESCETLWSRLPHSHRYHVICCHTASRPPMRTQSKTSPKGYGRFWYSTVCQYSSLWFCPHRSILLYGNLQNSLWCSSCAGGHGSFSVSCLEFLPLVLRCTRHRYGISGIITGILKFGDSATALMLTIFALQDSFGTACNVTGDGALTLILTGYARYHNIKRTEIAIKV